MASSRRPNARQGQNPRSTIRLEAGHSAAGSKVIVADDGAGVDVEKMRAAVIARNLINREAAERLARPSCWSSCSCLVLDEGP